MGTIGCNEKGYGASGVRTGVHPRRQVRAVNAVRPARDHQRRLFDGMPYDYLQVCGTPWSGNEYGPGQTAIWTMR